MWQFPNHVSPCQPPPCCGSHKGSVGHIELWWRGGHTVNFTNTGTHYKALSCDGDVNFTEREPSEDELSSCDWWNGENLKPLEMGKWESYLLNISLLGVMWSESGRCEHLSFGRRVEINARTLNIPTALTFTYIVLTDSALVTMAPALIVDKVMSVR